MSDGEARRENAMSKHRFTVTREFDAWRLSQRDDPDRSTLPMRIGFALFADEDIPGDFICFDMDAVEYEVDRVTFLASTARPSVIPPSPY